MIYQGEGAVESGGAIQQVASGMGTQMGEGEPPAPPEALLAAPAPRTPEAGSEWYRGDPPIEWDPVAGAAGYVVEVCRDAECGRLVQRDDVATGHAVETMALEAGAYHWRVTAVSPSGLDGYPSAATPFAVLSAAADREPPDIRLRFAGPSVEHDGTLYVGPAARLEVEVGDAASGVERAWAELDGVETQLAAAAEGWSEGRHEIVVRARDRAGNAAASEVLRFVHDTTPPEIHWGPEGGGVYHSFVGDYSLPASAGGNRTARVPALRWSSDRRSWQEAGTERWRVERREAPRFFLRRAARGLGLRDLGLRLHALPGVSMPLRRRAGVGVLAVDAAAGVEAVDFRLEAAAGGPRLVVECADRLGNRSRVEWPLARGRKRR
jgi:hypothetical protein